MRTPTTLLHRPLCGHVAGQQGRHGDFPARYGGQGRLGYGVGADKTVYVYVRRFNYQAASQSGVTGLNYCGAALGAFSGSFCDNATTNVISGALLNNLAAYFAEGSNAICLYNPSPSADGQGYARNYLAIKIYSKMTSSASVIIGGSFSFSSYYWF